MKLRTMKLSATSGKKGLFVLLGVLGLMSVRPVQAAGKPEPLKVGQTAKVTLEANEPKDYSVSLSKGSYRLVWDMKRVDEKSSNLIGSISLLKPNGVVIDSSVLGFNEIGVSYRVGSILNVPKPFVARFRIKDDADAINWFTVVPAASAKRVPFGWGGAITPARISSDNGVGGTLKPLQSVYHSITLPKGKWSISLGLELPDNENSNLIGYIDLLDTLGFAKKRLVNMNEVNSQARTEGILNVLKPTSYLLLVTNPNDNKTYKYDVTIEPAS